MLESESLEIMRSEKGAAEEFHLEFARQDDFGTVDLQQENACSVHNDIC